MTSKITLKINNFNCDYYRKKNITFVINKDITIPIDSLSPGSEKIVDVMCDYCGIAFKKKYRFYIEGKLNSPIHKDCCSSCQKFKNIESIQMKYGVDNVSFMPSVKIKISRHKKGNRHHNWQGGVSELSEHLRCLIIPWKEEILREQNFVCELTKQGGPLQVHHRYPFNLIIKSVLNELGILAMPIGHYSDDELTKIEQLFLKRHEELANPIVLLKSIHQDYHKRYGYHSLPDDFNEFSLLYKKAM